MKIFLFNALDAIANNTRLRHNDTFDVVLNILLLHISQNRKNSYNSYVSWMNVPFFKTIIQWNLSDVLWVVKFSKSEFGFSF